MAIDSALAADTCTYMEAVAGDGGVHDPAGVWWLSPDIQLIGSASGADKADPGVDNTIDVTLHSAAGTTCALPVTCARQRTAGPVSLGATKRPEETK